MQVTYILMAVIGLVTYFAWERPEWHRRLMLNPYTVVHEKKYYQLITSGFVHNNGIHLLLNLFTLYFFGLAIEQIFYSYFGDLGLVLYILLFITAVIVANIPTTIKHKNNYNYNSLGASGGVSALVMAFILFDPIRDLCLYAIICLPGYILGGLFIVYSIIMSKRNTDNINHDAHLFGAIYGVIFTLLLRPSTFAYFIEAIF
ncbi:rhomboid family intramembrane serine protease [Roseivirga seohaensis]|mgnify:FL=1|uniref:rhomboid family intramembrane serine protease n=1 Tax=Roseivirga seohaensis TaxID=1914963 RepID=UPI0030DD804F|tara:strand:- start:3530 stop:4135 length:606 start_codon:yes stop_codon:yes gene_type:complete